MSLIEKSAYIHAPLELVYQISQDYAHRHDWDPIAKKITVIAGPNHQIQEGTQVLARTNMGMIMLVQFVQICPPHRIAIEMLRGPSFIQRFQGVWNLTEVAPNVTEAQFRYLLELKPMRLRRLSEQVAGLYLSCAVGKRLHALKSYCERMYSDYRLPVSPPSYS